MRLKKIGVIHDLPGDFDTVRFAKVVIAGKEVVLHKIHFHSSLSEPLYIKVYVAVEDELQNVLKSQVKITFLYHPLTKKAIEEREVTVYVFKYKFFNARGGKFYLLHCYHKIHDLHFFGKNRVFKDKKISEIFKQILDESAVQGNFTFDGKDSQVTLCQYNETNYEFMCRMCSNLNVGYFINFKDGKVVFYNTKVGYSVKAQLSSKHKFKCSSGYVYVNKFEFMYRNKYQMKHEKDAFSETSKEFDARERSVYLGYTEQVMNGFKESFVGSGKTSATYALNNIIDLNLFAGVVVEEMVVLNYTIVYGFKDAGTKALRSRVEFIDSSGIVVLRNTSSKPYILFGTVVEKDNDVFFDDKEDKYMIKVVPHFEENEQNFLFARLSSMYAGNKHGAVFWPRHGTEVAFCFIGTMYSEMLVLGSLFNADNSVFSKDINMSYIYFNSLKTTKNEETMNALMFGNKKGEEKTSLSAAKDMDITTKEHTMVTSKTYSLKTEEDTDINVKNFVVNSQEQYKVDCKKMETESKDSYKIKVGDSSIEISSSSITIKAPSLKIDCQQSCDIATGESKVAISSAAISLEGATASLKSKGSSTVEGEMVMISGKSAMIKAGTIMSVSTAGVDII